MPRHDHYLDRNITPHSRRQQLRGFSSTTLRVGFYLTNPAPS